VSGAESDRQPDDVVVRKGEHGWVVGREEVSDLTSAMVLADLFAAEQQTDPPQRVTPPPPSASHEEDEAARLAVTVQQLEHALASRVQVEQAIGVLAERHRLRPREAFDLLRRTARSGGRRLTEMASDVIASTANPLLRLPEDLARKLPSARARGRSPRRARRTEETQPS
jgi:hypothetical protein